ncbi:uncharacterized protein DUF4197 [Litorimonas taeanensis]|uniref:Uncharacterized protein DUF4197 n=1 Tax=Litorimonas taeanensis TaxID=568099 RepID=A0A420WDE5_9PROT|nr:DUF4197 domain-containing protein [Litorimonas taeanensis]RKQ68912.1 uncharacterized protein DUF4197 [Litorimonas taeanensis]
MPLNRRHILIALPSLSLAACETLDPAILEGVLGSGMLSQAEAASGIRAALNNGIGHAISTVGQDGGFLNNSRIKIPLPQFLQDIQNVLQPIGAGGLLNDLQAQLNHGAEKAAPVAKDIFVDAVSGLSIQDAISIVRGPDNAATSYLQEKTSARLTDLFSPIMGNALQQTGALQLMDQLAGRLNSVPFAPSLGADAKTSLIQHGVDYGLKGVFTYIGDEEKAIRENPAKRTSEILRRVFGAANL